MVRGRAASHHIHFLMDEDAEDEEDEPGVGVACRALVLHPTKHTVRMRGVRVCVFGRALVGSLKSSVRTQSPLRKSSSFHVYRPFSPPSPQSHRPQSRHHPTKAGAPRASVDDLPRETLQLIFRFLPARSLCAAEMVCPLWRSIAAQDDDWWASLCESKFGVSPDSFTPPPDPTKMLYVLQYSSLLSIKRGGGGGKLNNWARFF